MNKIDNKYYELPSSVLTEIIAYIEETSLEIEWEWGDCRSLSKMKENNDMPALYYKMINIKNGCCC